MIMFSTYKCGFVPVTDVNYEMKPVKQKRNLPLLCEHILNYFKENHIIEDQNDSDMGPCYAMAGLYEYRLRTFISPLFFVQLLYKNIHVGIIGIIFNIFCIRY